MYNFKHSKFIAFFAAIFFLAAIAVPVTYAAEDTVQPEELPPVEDNLTDSNAQSPDDDSLDIFISKPDLETELKQESETVLAAVEDINTAEVTTEQELRIALSNRAITTINIHNDIQLSAVHTINRDLTIQGATGSVTLFSSLSNNVRHFNMASPNATITFSGVTLDGNSKSGGIMVPANMNITVNNAIIVNCLNTTNGGAVLNSGNLSLKNAKLMDNKATTNGGAVFSGPNSSLNILDGSSLTQNSSTWGGAIHGQVNCTVNVENSNISKNTATNGGGVVARILNIKSSTIENNKAVTGGGIYGFANYVGIDNCMVTVSDSTLSNNEATQGGGIYARSLVANNVKMTNNTASYGAAVYGCGSAREDENREIMVAASVLSENTAKEEGGAIYTHETAVLKVNGGEITENTAKNGAGIFGKSFSELNDVVIEYNTAAIHGGGIYASGDTTIAGSTKIKFNEAPLAGAGLFVKDAACSIKGITDFSINTITDEYATGAAIYAENAKLKVTEYTKIWYNNADGWGTSGCGIYSMNSDVELSGNTLFQTNNVGLNGGGALKAIDSTVRVLDHVDFSDNMASYAHAGGAIDLENSRIDMSGNYSVFQNGTVGLYAMDSLVNIGGSGIFNFHSLQEGSGRFDISSAVVVLGKSKLNVFDSVEFTNNYGSAIRFSGTVATISDDVLIAGNEQGIEASTEGELIITGRVKIEENGFLNQNIPLEPGISAFYAKVKIYDNVSVSGNNGVGININQGTLDTFGSVKISRNKTGILLYAATVNLRNNTAVQNNDTGYPLSGGEWNTKAGGIHGSWDSYLNLYDSVSVTGNISRYNNNIAGGITFHDLNRVYRAPGVRVSGNSPRDISTF